MYNILIDSKEQTMIHDFDKSSIDMVDWSCASCGCTQWMPKSFNEQLKSNNHTFYCLNGHGNVYPKKVSKEELQGKLINEYAKNAQLESVITDLKKKNETLSKSFVNRIFKR